MTDQTSSPFVIDSARFGDAITAASVVPSDIVFHPGPNETRFTAKGMIYRGELVEDAGAAHSLLLAVLNGRPLPPLAVAAARPPVQVSTLTGAQLDYWAARADGDFSLPGCGSPSSDWAWGGAIIDRERIEVSPLAPMRGGTDWRARCQSRDGRTLYCVNGPTPLIAAMRAFVTCVFGDTVPELPA